MNIVCIRRNAQQQKKPDHASVMLRKNELIKHKLFKTSSSTEHTPPSSENMGEEIEQR